jgi:hypothetical protein
MASIAPRPLASTLGCLGLERDNDRPSHHTRAALALAHYNRLVRRPLPRRLPAQGKLIERTPGLIRQARVVGSGAHQKVGPARDHQGEIVGTGMTTVGKAHLAWPHATTSETLRLAAPADLHHPNAQIREIKHRVHKPVVALVTRRHHRSGIDQDQALLARAGHRLRVALGQECGGKGAKPVGAGPQPLEDGGIYIAAHP